MIALDLFAGVGWGVALRSLGIGEVGIENDERIRGVRRVNGFMDLGAPADVWDWLPHAYFELAHEPLLLVASPPCQTFSMTGNGKGRAIMAEIHEIIDSGRFASVKQLREFGETHDMRTALVLTPLYAVMVNRPRFVVLEQVPEVLPIWEAYAEVMRGWGYTVDVGILRSEQFGVPQTRRRAFLVAQLGGPASLPTPTHSRYHSRKPLQMDEGLLPWVSMEDAGVFPDSVELVSTYSSHGNYDRRGVRYGDQPAPTITSHIDRTRIRFVSNKRYENSASRNIWEPAPTITAGHDTRADRVWMWDGKEERVTVAQAAALQTFPPDFNWTASRTANFVIIGNAVPPLLGKQVIHNLIGDTL